MPNIEYLYSKKITSYPNLVCGTLLSNYGTLQFNQGENIKKVIQNRQSYFKNLNIKLSSAIFQEQKHTTNIKKVTKKDQGKGAFSLQNIIKNNDGLMSSDKGIFLCVFTADCIPLSFFDPKTYTFGIAHVGWKGTLNLLAQKMVKNFKKFFDVKPKNLICYLGPSIGVCCYEVSNAKDGRVDKFWHRFGKKVIMQKKDKIFLDLKEAVVLQLRQLGVLQKNIEIAPICTCCSKKYGLPSYYKTHFQKKKKLTRSILSIIGIKDNAN